MFAMNTRTCKKCGNDFPLTDEYFYRHKDKLDGFESACIPCFKKRRMSHYHTPEGKEKNRISSVKAKKKIAKTSPARIMWWAARQRAKEKGIDCTITVDDIIIPTVCPVLGIPIFQSEKRLGPNSPSLDRIDSNKGYTPDNVRVISWRANALKKDASLDEIEKVYLYMKGVLSS